MKWRQKNGTLIEVSDMTDSHLMNAHAMVLRTIYRTEKTGDELLACYEPGDECDAGPYLAVLTKRPITQRKIARSLQDEITRRRRGEAVLRDECGGDGLDCYGSLQH